MNRLIKTALLWLLALALPVQGWAAVTQLSCAPVMQHAAMAQIVDHTAHVAHTMSSNEHHAVHSMMTAEEAPSHSSSSVPPKHIDMKCSACAACNIGMVALPSVHDWPLLPAGSIPTVAAPAVTFPAHIPDGIKRPPRSVLF